MTNTQERITIIQESSWARDNPAEAEKLIDEIRNGVVSPIVVQTSSVSDNVQSIMDSSKTTDMHALR